MEIRELLTNLGERLGLVAQDPAAVIALSVPAEGTFEVEVAKSGEFTSMSGRPVKISPELLQELAANHNADELRVPNKIGHPDPAITETPAHGTVTSLRYDAAKDRLLATVDPDPELRKAIREKRFFDRSIEYAPNWNKTGKARMLGLGWLGATSPAIPGLAALSKGGLDKSSTVSVMALGETEADEMADGEEVVHRFRDFTTADRKKAAKEGAALPDGSFPIYNSDDLDNAIHAIGRAKDPEAAKAHIKKRAKALGIALPDTPTWKDEKQAAAKGRAEDEMEDEAAVALAQAQRDRKAATAMLRDAAVTRADAFFALHKDRIPLSFLRAGARELYVELACEDQSSKVIKLAGDAKAGVKESELSRFEAFASMLSGLPTIVAEHEKTETARKEKASDEGVELSDSTKAKDIVTQYENVTKFAESKGKFHEAVLAEQEKDPKLSYTQAYEIVALARQRERNKKR